MADYYCSVCWNKESNKVTTIAGTVICVVCLDKVRKSEAETLKGKLAEVIEQPKEHDIYD